MCALMPPSPSSVQGVRPWRCPCLGLKCWGLGVGRGAHTSSCHHPGRRTGFGCHPRSLPRRTLTTAWAGGQQSSPCKSCWEVGPGSQLEFQTLRRVHPPTEPAWAAPGSPLWEQLMGEKSFGNWWAWDQLPAASLPGWVALGKFPDISEPIPQLMLEDNNTCLRG